MNKLSIRALFSLTLLLSVACASANPIVYEKKGGNTVPVNIIASAYEPHKEMHPVVPFLVSGGSGSLYGYLAAKTGLGKEIGKALVSGDPYQMLGAGLVTVAVVAQSADIRQRLLSRTDMNRGETFLHMVNGAFWAAVAYGTAVQK